MRVAVSGASGLIGTALTESLRRDGHEVLPLRRGGVSDGDSIGWDPDAGRIDAPALEAIDAVVHLAGEGIGERRWTDEQKRRIRESRVRGTAVLAGAIGSRERKPRVFVSGSAIGYYGAQRGDEILIEDSVSGDDFLAELCRDWESETQPAVAAGVRTVHLRSGIVLAKHGGVLARMLLPFKLGLGGRVGAGRQWMSWVTLDDEVGAIRHLIDNDTSSGPVNVTAPAPVTNGEFTTTLGRVLRRPTVLPTPLFPLKARYGAELVETLLLASQRVMPNKLRTSGYDFRHPVLEDALRAIL
ncbi:MAG: TIGR01777 family oxidoreductase [Actinomycetota bacterium]